MAEVAVFGFDSAGRVAVVNGKGETLTGYAAAELLGTDPFPRLFGQRAEVIKRCWFAAKVGTPVKMDASLRTRFDKERAVRWHVAPYLARSSPSPALVVVGLERPGVREQEPDAPVRKRLATAGVLAAGLAHEIRNPLNGASLHLSVLERALSRIPDLPVSAAEAIAVLRAETKRLSALVTDFLEVARPHQLALRMCDLNEIVRGAAALLEREIRGASDYSESRDAVESGPRSARRRAHETRAHQFDSQRVGCHRQSRKDRAPRAESARSLRSRRGGQRCRYRRPERANLRCLLHDEGARHRTRAVDRPARHVRSRRRRRVSLRTRSYGFHTSPRRRKR